MARKKDLFKFLLVLSISIGFSTSVFPQAQTDSIKGPRKFIDVDGIRTSYFEAGAGEDYIVLIHGGGMGSPVSSAATFTAWFPLLSAHFHVIAVDKLGAGFTDNPKTDADYSQRAVIDHIFSFIQKKGIKKFHVLGQSMGALPATRLAIEHPNMVKTLIIFDTASLAPDKDSIFPTTVEKKPEEANAHAKPIGTPLNEDHIFEKLLETVYSEKSIAGKVKEEWVKQSLEIALLPKMQEAEKRYRLVQSRLREIEILGDPGPNVVWAERNPDKILKDLTLDMISNGRVKAPTIIVWGANDPGAPHYHGYDLFEVFRAGFQKSYIRLEFHLYNEQNHWGWADHPQEMTDLLVMFIRNEL